MSDTAHAPAALAGGPEPDDGFTVEERAQFAEMEQAPRPDGDAPGEVAPEPSPTEVVAPVTGVEGADDEDDDEGDAAPVAGAPPAGAAAEKPKKRVSFGKFKRTEDELTATKAERDQLRSTQARLDERLKIINEAIGIGPDGQPKPQVEAKAEDVEPDAEADVFGWIAWKKRDDVRRDERFAAAEQSRQEQTAETELSTAYVDDARQFAQSEPTFGPAYNFLMNSRVAELAVSSFGKTDLASITPKEMADIKRTISAEERSLVKIAMDRQSSPAELIYRMSVARGFRPAAPAAGASAANGKGPAPTGLAAEAAAAVNGKGSVKDEIDRIKAGTEASKSLSSGGGAPASPLTAEKLASMPESEFNEMMETLSPEKLKEMFGN